MRIRLEIWIPLTICAASLGAFAQDTPASVPALPVIDTSSFLPAIRDQIERVESDAKASPRDAGAAGALAITLHAYEQYEAAGAAYARARQLDPAAFDWAYLGALLAAQQGSFDRAVEGFRNALRLRPGDLVTELRLGQSLIATGSFEEAGTLFERLTREHPERPQSWYGLGRVRAAQGEHEPAAQLYAKACEVFPLYGAAHFALAGELRRLGKRTEAEQHTAAYLKDPSAEPPLPDPLLQRVRGQNQSVHTHVQRGRDFEKEGKLEDSIREHEEALKIDAGNVQVHINLISLYGRTGDAQRARMHFEVATRLGPGRPDAWYNYGVLLFKDRAYPEAEKAFRRAVEINPYYAEAHNNLGAIYQMQSRFDEAAAEFRAAVMNKPDYPLARFHLARLLVREQKYAEAIQHLERALTPEDDQTPSYLYALAATYARSGDREHALTFYHRARDRATARGQSQLLNSIDNDLKKLSGGR